jgi:hypothetical protein
LTTKAGLRHFHGVVNESGITKKGGVWIQYPFLWSNHEVTTLRNNRMLRISLFLMLALLVSPTMARDRSGWETDILSDTFSYTEATPSDYPWNELIQACPRRDCIPAIDKPLFISAAQASFLSDDDIVIAIEVAGEARAYPIRILVHHELVNDTIAGNAVLVSYCPLCGSGLVFD